MTDRFVQDLADFACEPSGRGDTAFYRLAFLNWFGCALAGSRTRAVGALAAFHAADGTGTAQPLGRTERLPVSAAVEVDCLSSAALAYDDIHFETTLHPAGPVAAAILGLARTRPVGGMAALEALRVGMEVECRVALALFGPETESAPAWYPTGIAGGIGAAAAVGRLLGQDRATLMTGMALAAAMASGTRGTHGAMSAFWPPAIAAASGYGAALLASQGFTCPAGALSGPSGLIQQIAPRPDFNRALNGLGKTHVCEAAAPKIYPYGFVAYAAISSALTLHRWPAAAGRVLKGVDLHVSPTCVRLGGNACPANSFEAQVSLACILARVLTDPGLAYTPVPEAFAADHAHADLAQRVRVIADPTLSNDQCRLTAQYEDGGQLTVECDGAPGSGGNPIPPADVREKFLRLVTPLRGADAASALMQRIGHMETLDDLAQLQ